MEENMSIPCDTQALMNKFIKAVSFTINKTLALSINQSIDHIQKQYKIKKR